MIDIESKFADEMVREPDGMRPIQVEYTPGAVARISALMGARAAEIFYFASRTTETLHVIGSGTGTCDGCGHSVWLSPSYAQITGSRFIGCNVCLPLRREDITIVGAMP